MKFKKEKEVYKMFFVRLCVCGGGNVGPCKMIVILYNHRKPLGILLLIDKADKRRLWS